MAALLIVTAGVGFAVVAGIVGARFIALAGTFHKLATGAIV